MPTPLNQGQGAGYVGPQMREVLRRYGLFGLESWMSMAITKGWSQDEIMLQIRETNAFKERFPAILERERLGRSPLSVEDYLQYEATARSLSLTLGYRITQAEINNLLGNDVSLPELEERIGIATAAVYESDSWTRDELGRMFGIGTSDLIRYWMNPKEELPRMQQQFRMAEIAGAARRSGYGEITEWQAERLQRAGLDRDAAVAGFGKLNLARELFTPLDEVESAITDEEQIALLMGQTDIEQKLEKRRRRRQAEFEGGGEYALGEDSTGTAGFATGTAR
jgi:hypothetical protein